MTHSALNSAFTWVVLFGIWLAPLPAIAQEADTRAECGTADLAVRLEECLQTGQQVIATIELSNASMDVFGGQFFLEYDASVFSAVWVAPGDDPFIQPFGLPNLEPPGIIDYAVTVSIIQPWGATEGVMARIYLDVLDADGEGYIRFRRDAHPQTVLSGAVGACVTPDTVDFDGGDTDLFDFAQFQVCFSGDGNPATPVCWTPYDSDGDADVDLLDFQTLEAQFSGPHTPPCN